MRYTSHFVRYSLLFFVIFGFVFALIAFVSAGFDIHRMGGGSLASSLIRGICGGLLAVGCGYYAASFLVFQHKAFYGVFFAVNVLTILALKADGNLILKRLESFFHISPFVMEIILFSAAVVCIIICVVGQTRRNLVILHSGNVETNVGEQQLFM